MTILLFYEKSVKISSLFLIMSNLKPHYSSDEHLKQKYRDDGLGNDRRNVFILI